MRREISERGQSRLARRWRRFSKRRLVVPRMRCQAGIELESAEGHTFPRSQETAPGTNPNDNKKGSRSVKQFRHRRNTFRGERSQALAVQERVQTCHPMIFRKPTLLGRALVLVMFVSLTIARGSAAERIALVIGNNGYAHARPLQTAGEDAKDIAVALKEHGFEVIEIYDATQDQMTESVEELVSKAKEGQTDAVFFYFAGHGIESPKLGGNYLIPVDANLEKEAHLLTQAYSVNTLLERLNTLSAPVRVVMLDCCRNNPLEGRAWIEGRGESGLAPINPSSLGAGMLVAYSAAEGKVAKERLHPGDTNGPFANAFLEFINKTGISLLEFFGLIQKQVQKESDGTQRPKVFIPGELGGLTDFKVSPESQPLPKLINNGVVGAQIEVPISKDIAMAMCFIPDGTFTMGSPASEAWRNSDENPVITTIKKPFWMAKYECTQEQWKAVMGTNPSEIPGVDRPVESVRWDEAKAFVKKLNAMENLPEGWVWELPTEAQWEYACRAGTNTPFSFGNALNGTRANCNGLNAYGTSEAGPSLGQHTSVGSYPPNQWGLHDMHGNVWEWCLDYYAEQLPGGDDPVVVTKSEWRVDRGGSFVNSGEYCRSACRGVVDESASNLIGFRLVLVQK